MKLEFINSQTNGVFSVGNEREMLTHLGILRESTINSIVFNFGEDQIAIIDEVCYTFPGNTVLPLMANQNFRSEHPEQLMAWQFNREFYCIVDHDAEVGCVGFLFYGINNPMFIDLSEQDITNIKLTERFCKNDMQVKDRMQNEMLRTLLKRIIISVTRLAREQTTDSNLLTEDKLDLVRKFNLMLEFNFKTEHEVRFYAGALNKSPKTLSNTFALLKFPSPSKLIQNRIILEAKRYLNYTDRSAKEIAYMLGFVSPAHFSRFFRQHTGENISFFRSGTTSTKNN
ncbi:MAG: helix-turn-helix domain-containing protein [Sphingobacterium sp.]|uniref:AraC family transcriptional regulator n=1 Tax=Sphingobacterium sp. JB170 TaxID=1434842 RepID=UPI00097E8F8C|nr:helix-turn-helix domain-containing protein [Sphingobacterium sp. JB170]SJN47209.1 transcriptional regulator, AraC family [Sphingobacterium sp. JB170]